MKRIGFLGVPGAGKTSTARALASACRRIEGVKNVELVSEYARRYISKHGPIENMWEQIRILNKQLDWERTAAEKADLIITDSPVHLGLGYASITPCECDKDVMIVNDLFSMLRKLDHPSPHYDIIFHLPPILKPVEDGVRSSIQFDETWRKNTDELMVSVFRLMPPKKFWRISSVNMDERVKECLGVIEQMQEQEIKEHRAAHGVYG